MIDATVNLSEVTRALTRLGKFGRDLTPVFREARRPMMADQRQHAKNTEGSDGKWPGRADSTRERGARKGRKRLGRLLGRLPGALDTDIKPLSIRIKSRVKWSRAQQEGDRVGHGSKLPPREFLWPSPSLLTTFVSIVERHMGKAWTG